MAKQLRDRAMTLDEYEQDILAEGAQLPEKLRKATADSIAQTIANDRKDGLSAIPPGRTDTAGSLADFQTAYAESIAARDTSDQIVAAIRKRHAEISAREMESSEEREYRKTIDLVREWFVLEAGANITRYCRQNGIDEGLLYLFCVDWLDRAQPNIQKAVTEAYPKIERSLLQLTHAHEKDVAVWLEAPRGLSAYESLGYWYFASGNEERALEFLQRGMEHGNTGCITALGRYWARNGQREVGIDMLKMAFERHHSELAGMELAIAAYEDGELDSALNYVYLLQNRREHSLYNESIARIEYQVTCAAYEQRGYSWDVRERLLSLLSVHPEFRGMRSRIDSKIVASLSKEFNEHVGKWNDPVSMRTALNAAWNLWAIYDRENFQQAFYVSIGKILGTTDQEMHESLYRYLLDRNMEYGEKFADGVKFYTEYGEVFVPFLGNRVSSWMFPPQAELINIEEPNDEERKTLMAQSFDQLILVDTIYVREQLYPSSTAIIGMIMEQIGSIENAKELYKSIVGLIPGTDMRWHVQRVEKEIGLNLPNASRTLQ